MCENNPIHPLKSPFVRQKTTANDGCCVVFCLLTLNIRAITE